jgi:hypothetical protein
MENEAIILAVGVGIYYVEGVAAYPADDDEGVNALPILNDVSFGQHIQA